MMAAAVNDERWSVASIIDHDYSLPPIGKAMNASVVELADGNFALDDEEAIFDNSTTIRLSTGQELFKQSTCDKRPFAFVLARAFLNDKMIIDVEERNFVSIRSTENFIAELNKVAPSELHTHHEKDLFVLPSALMLLGSFYIFKVASRTLDKVADKHAEEIVREGIELKDLTSENLKKLVRFSNETVRQWIFNSRKGERVPQFHHRLKTNPIVELVYKGEDFEWAALGFTEEALRIAYQQAQILKEEQNANFVQFLFGDNLVWQLNYATTETGDIIATANAFAQRDDRFKEMEKQAKEQGRDIGVSVSFSVPSSGEQDSEKRT